MDLKVLLGLELFVTHVAGYVLGLNRVHVDNMLFEVRVVGVNFATLGTFGFAREAVAVHLLLLKGVYHRDALHFFLRTSLQHQAQLVVLRARVLLLL